LAEIFLMQVTEITPERLAEYAAVPIAFEVRTIYEVETPDGGLGGIHLRQRPVSPYRKDYDLLHSPLSWPGTFDLKNWGLFLALDSGQPVGGAVVAWDTPGVDMLAGRRDIAVLWDIRVAPERRGQGLGGQLFRHAAAWSKMRGCRWMKIETQNTNVAACRFYAAQGARLGDIRRFAYSEDPPVAHEIQLNWYFDCSI
jgi:ribosomal protein S18 acetylase RimI-like enzyme